MDTDKVERLRERMLQCSVCMDEFKDPRILPCHHTLCYDCIFNVVQSSSVSGRLFKCPQCRADVCVPRGGIDELPINFYITSLQEELGATSYSGICHICKRDWLTSQFRCIDCDVDICRFCIHAHRLETHTDPPKILRIETTNSNSCQLMSNVACEEHTEEILQLFCTSCHKAICISCSFHSHKKHKIIPLNTKLKESKTYLQSEVDALTVVKRNAMKTAEFFQDIREECVKLANGSLLALDAAAHKACNLIMNKKSMLEKEILSSEEMQLEKIDNALKDFKLYMQRVERGMAFLLDLQDDDICLEVINTYKDYLLKLEAARKMFSSNHVHVDYTQFRPSDSSHLVDANMGVNRKLLYYGNLGTMCKKSICLSVNPKTLNVVKHYRGIGHVVDSHYFKRFLHFLLVFVICQVFFYLGDTSGFFDMIMSMVMVFYSQIVDVLKGYSNSTQ
ncbi:probable E3 ubiquitin-protein ligase MID2 [Physella acuta]|uniref:probable E3 ubiquitin-protein ligase MID2 n=1 Tax=Physella acuta TaxID=109671 RepID=UPI0027DC3CD5|nr:probable E3 ubiquitin-protein ligase MID2 [Physella acuta]